MHLSFFIFNSAFFIFIGALWFSSFSSLCTFPVVVTYSRHTNLCSIQSYRKPASTENSILWENNGNPNPLKFIIEHSKNDQGKICKCTVLAALDPSGVSAEISNFTSTSGRTLLLFSLCHLSHT